MSVERPFDRRRLLIAILASPLAFPGCGGSPDGSQVQVGDATKAEVKTRADLYKERALQKRKNAKR